MSKRVKEMSLNAGCQDEVITKRFSTGVSFHFMVTPIEVTVSD